MLCYVMLRMSMYISVCVCNNYACMYVGHGWLSIGQSAFLLTRSIGFEPPQIMCWNLDHYFHSQLPNANVPCLVIMSGCFKIHNYNNDTCPMPVWKGLTRTIHLCFNNHRRASLPENFGTVECVVTFTPLGIQSKLAWIMRRNFLVFQRGFLSGV